MSNSDHLFDSDLPPLDAEAPAVPGDDAIGDDESEFEEISSDEVDRVIDALEQLMEGVCSENIRAYLEEAANNIYSLVYDDDVDYIEVDDPEDLAA